VVLPEPLPLVLEPLPEPLPLVLRLLLLRRLPEVELPRVEPLREPDVEFIEPERRPPEPDVLPMDPEVEPIEPELRPEEPEVEPIEPDVEPDVEPMEPEVEPIEPEVEPIEPDVEPDVEPIEPLVLPEVLPLVEPLVLPPLVVCAWAVVVARPRPSRKAAARSDWEMCLFICCVLKRVKKIKEYVTIRCLVKRGSAKAPRESLLNLCP
jgi:hypothetical protein